MAVYMAEMLTGRPGGTVQISDRMAVSVARCMAESVAEGQPYSLADVQMNG